MITYSVSATVTRATQFNRTDFRKIGMTSGPVANKEFSGSVDLSVTPLPQLPILIVTTDMDTINFLGLQVTGGEVLIRLSHDGQVYNNIDLPVSGTLLMSGIQLKQVYVLGVISGAPFVEVFGMGS